VVNKVSGLSQHQQVISGLTEKKHVENRNPNKSTNTTKKESTIMSRFIIISVNNKIQ